VNIWLKVGRLCTCLKQTCRDWNTSYPSLLWLCWGVSYRWKIVWNSVCSSLLCVRRLIKQMRVFCQEKCDIAIKHIINLCEKNDNIKTLVSDNSDFYVIVKRRCRSWRMTSSMSWNKTTCLSRWPRSEWPLANSSIQPFVILSSSLQLNARRKLCDDTNTVTSTVYCQVQSSCSFVSGDSQMGFDSFVCFLVSLMPINTRPFRPACFL